MARKLGRVLNSEPRGVRPCLPEAQGARAGLEEDSDENGDTFVSGAHVLWQVFSGPFTCVGGFDPGAHRFCRRKSQGSDWPSAWEPSLYSAGL